MLLATQRQQQRAAVGRGVVAVALLLLRWRPWWLPCYRIMMRSMMRFGSADYAGSTPMNER